MHVGKSEAGARKDFRRHLPHHTPGLGIARMAGQLPAPQEGSAVIEPVAWGAAMNIGGKGLGMELRRGRGITGLEMGQRQVPVEMAVERAIARVAGQPGRKESAGAVRVALFVAEMRAGMRHPRVFRVLRKGAVYDRPRRLAVAILRQRHAVMSAEPPVVSAIAWRELVEQSEQRALLVGAPGI